MVMFFLVLLHTFFIHKKVHYNIGFKLNLTGNHLVGQAWEGVGVVASARKLIGSTNPLQAEPGTIRGDLAVQTGRLDFNL